LCGVKPMDKRVGVVGVVIEDRHQSAGSVNAILSEYGDIIVGRMGLPYKQRGVSIIALIVDGSTDEIGAMTGKLGSLPGVNVKTAMSKT
jgi:putative iron-only hydrogenase system regulator